MNKIMMIGVGVALLTLGACSDAKTAKKVLNDAGFTEVQTNGYGWFGCGKDDTFATEFVAKNQNGKTVKGVVCSGWFKGGTIRFY